MRTTTPPPPHLAACLAAGLLACTAPAHADRFLLIDTELNAQSVNVLSFGPGGATVADERGGQREVPLAEIIALAPSWWRPGTDESELAWSSRGLARRVPPGAGMVLLTDGRRVAGRLASSPGPERIAWDHPRLGQWVLSLEDVRRLQLQAFPIGVRRSLPGSPNDRVVMTNADAVSGFVESVGDVVRIDSDGRAVDLNIKQVALVDLANPKQQASGMLVWLEDGSVIGASSLAPSQGTSELRIVRQHAPSAEPTLIPGAQLVALVPDAARVVPLAALPIASQERVGDRLYVDPAALRWRGEVLASGWRDEVSSSDRLPPLDTPDIELPGPMSVEWTLPEGAERVAGWAEIPAEARVWAECSVVIEAVSGSGNAATLASESMSGARPTWEYNLPLGSPAPARLRVRVEPGARGPIQDRVVLRRALVLVRPSGG